MMQHLLKRIIDISISALLLILLLPLMLLLAMLILIFMGSPVIFKQQRPGLHGKPFFIYKFCTMRYLFDERGELLPDEKRITKFGKFLRSTSLDELPELFNVLAGSMSLIGPRPLIMEYLNYYSAEQHRRHDVRPGITGLAQVNGRNALAWEKRFELDVWYIDHWSLWLDFKILLKTMYKVFLRDGISEKGYATVSKFLGGSIEIQDKK